MYFYIVDMAIWCLGNGG